jgi:hypothetical protein
MMTGIHVPLRPAIIIRVNRLLKSPGSSFQTDINLTSGNPKKIENFMCHHCCYVPLEKCVPYLWLFVPFLFTVSNSDIITGCRCPPPIPMATLVRRMMPWDLVAGVFVFSGVKNVGWEVNDFIHGMGFFQNHFLGMISFAWDS